MDIDWLPHGVMNRMLTSTHLTERILGSSKVATVSTRTLFRGSGNNVGPIRDLVRRVITITLDPQCATPATLQYQGDPLATVRKTRADLVCAVLTIVRAWQMAGSPKSNVPNIASYGGAWSDYCRHPLIWLGMPDPATALFEQLKNDPDREALGKLLSEWYRRFGSAATTIRKVVAKAYVPEFWESLDEAERDATYVFTAILIAQGRLQLCQPSFDSELVQQRSTAPSNSGATASQRYTH